MNKIMNTPTMGKFNINDVEEAIKQVNFNKGIGPDMLDGSCLINDLIRKNFTSQLLDILNGISTMPEFFKKNKLILFSKTDSP